MKVYKNCYKNHWISPYTICEKIFWWREIDYNEPWVQTVNCALEPVMLGVKKILDVVDPKIDYVKIDPWDTWSMDSTLSPIILALLRQLHADNHGAPYTDDADVPSELRSTTKSAQLAKENDWDTDGNHFQRWNWILKEMIWAFEQLADTDNDDQFYTGVHNESREFDKTGYQEHQKRISNGTRLFGKYYQNLWD
jgi:hypothetical protein